VALHQIEVKILAALDRRMGVQELAGKADLPLDSVLSFGQSLKEDGYVEIFEEKRLELRLTPEGEAALANRLPENRVYDAAFKKPGVPVSELSAEERVVGLPWAIRNGWVKVESGTVVQNQANIPNLQHLHGILQEISEGKPVADEDAEMLAKRGLASRREIRSISLERTGKQAEAAESGGDSEANLLTREMLLSGSWKGSSFREYDVSAPVEVPSPARRHAVSRLRRRIAGIFTEMGFEEMEGPEVQSAFWNFDALFQPQDHPARDLADTFYVKGSSPLPEDRKLVDRIRKVQEKNWGGTWTEENAERTVLRTHTTALSAAYLYNYCQEKSPKRYFSIGKVYRNEATDYKHLAEFFQVEGIVAWEGATFRDLLGCLRAFYRKLGFEKIRFQPSYFPYTEPSLEVSVYFDRKKQWMELGGAGIFRPEVSIPLCDRYPVLAWGLSLERPLMLLNDMDDIRDFYRSNIGWIRRQKMQL
jgi:phenylalanyl-tRNA synthetase alpha chain